MDSPENSNTEDTSEGHLLDGKYRVISRLGGGGMGAVYKARHELMDRLVAIKVIHSHLVDPENDEFLKRFTREAKTTSKIRHPNAIIVHDFGIADARPYIVMEYIDGRALEEVLIQQGPFDVPSTIELMQQVCGALAAAHAVGVIHRDLKPANIMLADGIDSCSAVRVVDFGIAKVLGQSDSDDPTVMTKTGGILGTPSYMSPEQARGRKLDARSDIYSLGIVIYELLTGEVPFQADSSMDVILQHINDTPGSLRELKPELKIPEAVERVVLKALAKKPNNRQQSVEELLRELQAAAEETLVTPGNGAAGMRATAKADRPSRSTGSSLQLVAGFIVFLIVLGIMVWAQNFLVPGDLASVSSAGTALRTLPGVNSESNLRTEPLRESLAEQDIPFPENELSELEGQLQSRSANPEVSNVPAPAPTLRQPAPEAAQPAPTESQWTFIPELALHVEESESGVVIRRIDSKLEAAKALQPGDIVIEVDNQVISNTNEFLQATMFGQFFETNSSTRTMLVVSRGARLLTVSLPR